MVLLWLGITPKTDDKEKLARHLALLCAHDSRLAARTGAAGTPWLGAESEDQLEAVVHRLKESGIEAAVTRPFVAYKETLTQPADGAAKYTTPAEGYAHVILRVAPGEPGSGLLFENTAIGSAIPAQYATAISEGVAAGLESGARGYPIENLRVTVYDGSYHDVDSSPAAFRHAARLAFHDAAQRAGAVLLEPIMSVEVGVPAEYARAVADGLLARRAEVFSLWEDDNGGRVRVRARVPLAEMFAYRHDLRERTRGLGTFSMSLSHYAPVTHAGEDGERAAGVTAPLRPRTPLRTRNASVPEPTGDDGANL